MQKSNTFKQLMEREKKKKDTKISFFYQILKTLKTS